MPLYNDEAIVLRHWDLGESDRIVSFFGKKCGRIRVVAKGAKKLKSRFMGRIEQFHKVKIVYFGKEQARLFKLSGIDLLENNSALSSDTGRYVRACYFAEMLEAGLKEGDPNSEAFEIAEKILKLFSSGKTGGSLEWMTRFFDVKFLSALGYRPSLERCLSCKGEFALNSRPSFDTEGGGMVCQSCKTKKSYENRVMIPMSLGAVRFLAKIVSTGIDKAERLKPSQSILGEITMSITAFRDSKLQRVFKSERFFDI
jgi:DNA repair protein RecO (recombination protein O)